MTDEDSLTRRSVLGKLTVLLAAVLGITTGAAGAKSDESPADPQQSKIAAKNRMGSKDVARPRNGIHTGTIDRIVDGDHVVILLESDGETVGQYVVDHDRVPDGEEGDGVTVWLFRGTVIGVWVD